jgi:trehalose 6-phosphate synthase
MDEYSCLPVYLSDELADRHYNGFSNSILWPLFHYRASAHKQRQQP